MANNRAQTGSIAATAGASSGGPAASVEATGTATPAGTADVIATDPAKTAEIPGENHPEVTEKAKELLDSALNAAKTNENASKVGETVNVKVLKPHPELGAFAGTTTKLPTELATRLAASGHVVEVSDDGKALRPTYNQPTGAQLAAGKAAFDRFRAVAIAEEEDEDLMPTEGQFSDLPASIQRAFVAAIDPTYGPQA